MATNQFPFALIIFPNQGKPNFSRRVKQTATNVTNPFMQAAANAARRVKQNAATVASAAMQAVVDPIKTVKSTCGKAAASAVGKTVSVVDAIITHYTKVWLAGCAISVIVAGTMAVYGEYKNSRQAAAENDRHNAAVATLHAVHQLDHAALHAAHYASEAERISRHIASVDPAQASEVREHAGKARSAAVYLAERAAEANSEAQYLLENDEPKEEAVNAKIIVQYAASHSREKLDEAHYQLTLVMYPEKRERARAQQAERPW